MWISSLPSTICWRDYHFLLWVVLPPGWRLFDHLVRVSFWAFSILLHCLYSCLLATFDCFVVHLKWGSVRPPTSFFFRIVLAVWDSLRLYMSFRVSFLSLHSSHSFLLGSRWLHGLLWVIGRLSHTKPSDPWTWLPCISLCL